MQTEAEPYLVRRKKQGASAEMSPGGSRAGQVDWRQSLLLNLAVHSAYWLTVAAGPAKLLPAGVLGTAEAPPGSVKVQQHLHTPFGVRDPRGCAGERAGSQSLWPMLIGCLMCCIKSSLRARGPADSSCSFAGHCCYHQGLGVQCTCCCLASKHSYLSWCIQKAWGQASDPQPAAGHQACVCIHHPTQSGRPPQQFAARGGPCPVLSRHLFCCGGL